MTSLENGAARCGRVNQDVLQSSLTLDLTLRPRKASPDQFSGWDTKTTYVPGDVYTPLPYYGTFYGYYGALYPMIYSPGYMKTEKEAQVEVNFYATAKPDGELVWTGTTNTFEASSAMKAIKGLVKIVAKELERENIIEPESK